MPNKYDLNMSEKSHGCGSNGGGCCGGHGEHHEHGGTGCCKSRKKELDKDDLSDDEHQVLQNFLMYNVLPVARFVLKSSKEEDFMVHALSPVYIEDVSDKLEKVKSNAEILTSLEEKGFICIDYDIEISNCDYSEYVNSNLYKHFQETVKEGKTRHNFLGDISEIELGSMAITNECAEIFQGEYSEY